MNLLDGLQFWGFIIFAAGVFCGIVLWMVITALDGSLVRLEKGLVIVDKESLEKYQIEILELRKRVKEELGD